MWLHGHLNGRRDTLIFRGRLREPPAFEVEALQPALWTGREALGLLDLKAWTKVALNGDRLGGLVALVNGKGASEHLQAWLSRLGTLPLQLARLSLRRSEEYQIQFHTMLPPRGAAAADVIGFVQRVGNEAGS